MVYYKRFDAVSRDCVYIIKYNSVDESSELRSCVNVEVAVVGSPSLISLMVFVDVKQH